MTLTIDRALDFLAKQQNNQKLLEKQRQLQRRNTVTDTKADFRTMLRGKDRLYTAFKIGKDMQYIMRYSFNLHVRPVVTLMGLETEPISLSINQGKISPTSHMHKMKLEATAHENSLNGLRLLISGVDITNAIIAEYGSFITGYGYFPNEQESYDILRIIEYLPAWQQSVLLSSGMKEIQLTQNVQTLCECEISYYVKYNHVDRGGLE